MSKKILLIENDQDLLGRLTASLEESGFEVRATGDGKEGLDLARDWAPEAIVLCVELPGMSGYLVCQKLKKDEALKGVPLVLTSAEATEETFEKHRTLKARADEYLLKPYEPPALVEKLGALIGLPEGAPAPAEEGEEELVSLEEELGGAGEAEAGAEVAGLELESLPDEPSTHAPGAAVDEDLRLLDDAFDGLSDAPATGADEAAAALDELTGEKPMAGDEVDAAAASLPEEDEAAARAALGGLDSDTDAALGALGAIDETLSPGLRLDVELPPEEPPALPEPPPPPPPARPLRGASADLLRAAGIKVIDDAPAAVPERASPLVPPPPEPYDHVPAASSGELSRIRAELDEARAALERMRSELAGRDGELRELRRKAETLGRRADDADAAVADAKSRAETAQEKARKAEADVKAAKDETRRATDQARAAETELADSKRRAGDLERRLADAEKHGAESARKLDELETRAAAAEEDARRKAEEAAAAVEALGRAEALEREAEGLKTELLVARSEAEGARGEVEKRTAELKKRVTDLEATNSKNEERVVKAYQKIKADEKVRDKVRKALAIAAQLLEDGAPAEPAADKRPAPAREDRP